MPSNFAVSHSPEGDRAVPASARRSELPWSPPGFLVRAQPGLVGRPGRSTTVRRPAAAVLESRSRLPELASIGRERELASAPRGVGGSALRKPPAYSLEKHYAVDKVDPAFVHRPHREAHPASYTLRLSSPCGDASQTIVQLQGITPRVCAPVPRLRLQQLLRAPSV